MNTYFLDRKDNILCFECGIEAEDAIQCRNTTYGVLTCSCCGQEIPFAGQTHQARRSVSATEWDNCLNG